MTEQQRIGAAVRRFRRRVNLSQVELAALWHVSQAQVSEIENGFVELRLSARQVRELAQHVRLPVETVLYEMAWPIRNVDVTLGQVIDREMRDEQQALYSAVESPDNPVTVPDDYRTEERQNRVNPMKDSHDTNGSSIRDLVARAALSLQPNTRLAFSPAR